jgi:hypothetical protein
MVRACFNQLFLSDSSQMHPIVYYLPDKVSRPITMLNISILIGTHDVMEYRKVLHNFEISASFCSN